MGRIQDAGCQGAGLEAEWISLIAKSIIRGRNGAESRFGRTFGYFAVESAWCIFMVVRLGE